MRNVQEDINEENWLYKQYSLGEENMELGLKD